jgi:hypothetical protein
VSFSRDLFPKMTGNGVWKCASAGTCHGNGTQAPVMDAATAATVIASLKDYPIGTVPYITQGGDPAQSAMFCNLSCGCGKSMPLDPGAALTDNELCQVQAWLKCGAPNN